MSHDSKNVSMVRKSTMATLRKTVLEIWGPEGLEKVERLLSNDNRQATLHTPILLDSWYPVTFLLEWHEDVSNGPAEGKVSVLRTFIDRSMDHGFGVIEKIFLSIATPDLIVSRAANLWRSQHSSGEITAQRTAEGARIILSQHVYNRTKLGREVVTEVFRYIASLSRIPNVSAQHELIRVGELEVRLFWR